MGRIHVSSMLLSFLISQKQTCSILRIKSYYRLTVDDRSAIAGAHLAGQLQCLSFSTGIYVISESLFP